MKSIITASPSVEDTTINKGVIKMEDNAVTLYTVAEVATILKTNVDYVHKLRKAGLLTFIKLGSYKIRKETLINFLTRYDGKDVTDPFNIKEVE
jgi:excisionase family DNA binding protein